jgi:hypothetical protein
MAATATGGTMGWEKNRAGAVVDGAFEISPSRRELRGRRRLEPGECRITAHDHASGYRQIAMRVTSGCAVALDVPGAPHPLTGIGTDLESARPDAKQNAKALAAWALDAARLQPGGRAHPGGRRLKEPQLRRRRRPAALRTRIAPNSGTFESFWTCRQCLRASLLGPLGQHWATRRLELSRRPKTDGFMSSRSHCVNWRGGPFAR